LGASGGPRVLRPAPDREDQATALAAAPELGVEVSVAREAALAFLARLCTGDDALSAEYLLLHLASRVVRHLLHLPSTSARWGGR
jgi:hypothetical protein